MGFSYLLSLAFFKLGSEVECPGLLQSHGQLGTAQSHPVDGSLTGGGNPAALG